MCKRILPSHFEELCNCLKFKIVRNNSVEYLNLLKFNIVYISIIV